MRRDSLATLTRLRSIGTAAAKADLARAAVARQDAAAKAEGEARLVLQESPELDMPRTYGTWLVAQLARRQQARADEAEAAVREEQARLALVEARRAERVIELLAESRAAEARRRAGRREAALLDEAASRRGA